MNSFNYNNTIYNINDIVLLKYKSRLIKYIIKHIELKDELYHLVKFIHYDYNYVYKNVKFPLKSKHKFIKKFYMNEEPANIKCTILKRNPLVYKINCDFCNTIRDKRFCSI